MEFKVHYVSSSYWFSSITFSHKLFVKVDNGDIILLLLYVDDIILTRSSPTKIQEVINNLAEVFDLKDMGKLTYFLGLHVQYNVDVSLFIHQQSMSKNY